MQTQSDERENITKLFRDAFVRVCQLAIADCGISVVDLTLHLSIELNTGTPQIFGTVVAETVRSPSAKDSSAARGNDALNNSFSVDDNNVDSNRTEKGSFACDSFDPLVHGSSIERSDLEIGSSSHRCTEEIVFKAAKDTPLTTCALTTNSIDNLILSDNDHETVPLEELLSDVVESNGCSNSACIATDSALSDTRGTDIEDGFLSQDDHLLYGKMADRSAAEGDISYEEGLIVDESYSSSNTSANHAESLQPEVLCSSLNSQPVSSEAATCVNDISFLKLYPGDCLLPKCCPDLSNPACFHQPKISTTSPSSCRLVRANVTDTAIVPWETEFQKILSTMSTNVTVAVDAGQDNLHTYASAERRFADDQMKRYPCTQCDCSFSMWTNLRRHIKKSHCQPLWRPIAPTAGTARKLPKMVATPSKVTHISSKDSSRYRHKCTICKAAFTLRTNLTRHVRRIHGSTGSGNT